MRRLMLAAAITASTVLYFLVPDAAGAWTRPDLARMLFFHLPCAFAATLFLIAMSWFGWRYLSTRRLEWDARLEAATEVGLLFASLTMVTGILFSQVQWNAWWNWDPRQTSFLLVLLLMGASVALRGALPDEHRRASACSAYAMATLLPSIFLLFVYPRLPTTYSLHPSTTITNGELVGIYRYSPILIGLVILWFGIVAYRSKVKAVLLEKEFITHVGPLESDLDPAPPARVGRAVRVSSDGGPEG